MKRLLRIFELSNSEQRVVLVVVLVLIAIGFVGYERRVRHLPIQPISATQAKPSPTVEQIEEDR
jgi:hypothetical protein